MKALRTATLVLLIGAAASVTLLGVVSARSPDNRSQTGVNKAEQQLKGQIEILNAPARNPIQP